jgi:hypothetical protein
MSSFDSFRTACTKDEIIKIVERAKQTVVMSHDATFLKCIYDAADRPNLSTLHIVRSGDTLTLDEWKLTLLRQGGVLPSRPLRRRFA